MLLYFPKLHKANTDNSLVNLISNVNKCTYKYCIYSPKQLEYMYFSLIYNNTQSALHKILFAIKMNWKGKHANKIRKNKRNTPSLVFKVDDLIYS